MFSCCGCPGKKSKRADNDREGVEEEFQDKVEVTIKTPVLLLNSNETDLLSRQHQTVQTDIIENDNYSPAKLKNDEFCDGTVAECNSTMCNLPANELRKSSLKKAKPRLSINTDVEIIPELVLVEDAEPLNQSPLSDEVFSGEAVDPPRANLGVGLAGVLPSAIEFPRSPNPDKDQLATSPRGKAGTPHPKRASMPAVLPRWQSEDEEEVGLSEPPVTPIDKSDIAFRRHQFFSELLSAAQEASKHRASCDPLTPPSIKRWTDHEFDRLLDRLEKITARLEKAVPIFEEAIEPIRKALVVTKSIEDLLDEHLTPVEIETINDLISDKLISTDLSGTFNTDVFEPVLIEKGGDDRNDSASDCLDDKLLLSADEIAFTHPTDFNTVNNLPLPDLPTDLPTDSSQSIENGTLKYSSILPSSIEDFDFTLQDPILWENNSSNILYVRKELDQSDTDDNSSDSPDTVVCDIPTTDPLQEQVLLPTVPLLTMTNSQSTLNMSVEGYEAIVKGPFAIYQQLSLQIGGDVSDHAKLVQQAFQAQLQYLVRAAQSRKPGSAEEQLFLQPTSQCIAAIQDYREKHRTSPLFNHLSAISESIPALGWVTVSPAPSPFVKEMNDAGQFYTNRVLKDWKEKDKKHVEWVKAWVSTLVELQSFVKQHHTTGLVWSGTGASAPLPPPPPPLDLNFGDMELADNDRSALFAEINRGDAVTKGLKKVSSDMQTHKNPSMRSGPAPFKAPTPVPTQKIQTPKPAVDKPPVFTRDGKKWLIEYQKGNRDLIVSGAEMNNVVYVFRCTDSVITVKGKVNSIFLDSCKKTAVVFDSVVSSVEFVNCQSVQMQVLGTVPTISVDKTDGCQMYVNEKSLAVEIVSSKSSEMNVLVPKPDGSGDFTEYPIPEQFRTTIGKSGLSTFAVESTG